MIAKNFHKKDLNVIINGYLDESAWEELVKQVELTHKILLLPRADIAKLRDEQRHENFRMGREAVDEHYEHFSTVPFYKDFVKIDSSNHNIERTVKQVTGLLA